MKVEKFIELIEKIGIDFYTGVPDSQLKQFCDKIVEMYGISDKHIVAANEGASVGLAAGHYLSTNKPALVYMQNSGIGNAVNPICSLLNNKVYSIPTLFLVGWRGEPGVKDEPQHVYQGEITVELLELLGIKTYIINKELSDEIVAEMINEIKNNLDNKNLCAIVVKKDAFTSETKMNYKNNYIMSREKIVNIIVDNTNEGDIFVSTTGKMSRELFEARETRNQSHKYDFLTVGSMGHSSMIALGISKNIKERKVFCLDGDGAVLMHLGSLPVLASMKNDKFVHIIVDNEAHETVGGIPTVSKNIDYVSLANACGYNKVFVADDEETLIKTLKEVESVVGPVLVHVKANLDSRSDLGRPTTTPIENKDAFMEYLRTN